MADQHKFEFTGPVEYIGDVELVGAKDMEKRIVVVGEGDKYPQSIPFELIKEKCALVDDVLVGDMVTVHFNLRGREYNGRYYSNLQCWELEHHSTSRRLEPDDAAPAPVLDVPEAPEAPVGEDGLPF